MACPLLLEQILMPTEFAKGEQRVATYQREREESLRDVAPEALSEIEIYTRPTRTIRMLTHCGEGNLGRVASTPVATTQNQLGQPS
jgi:hypothetical protein